MVRMQTYTGREFYPMNPRAEDVDVVDIAHALANTCRFGGHCKRFYSVAQHCCEMVKYYGLWMSRHDTSMASGEHKAGLLLHDAAEAYIGDIISPIKQVAFSGSRIEYAVQQVIANALGASLVAMNCNFRKYADNVMLHWEKRDIMKDGGFDWELPEIESVVLDSLPMLVPISPGEAEAWFLRLAYELLGADRRKG